MKTNTNKAKQTAIDIELGDGTVRHFKTRSTASCFINKGFRRQGSDAQNYAYLMRQFEDGQTHLYWTEEATHETAEETQESACVIEVAPETTTSEKKPRKAKGDGKGNPNKFKFLGDDSVVRFEVGKEYVQSLKNGETAMVKVVVRKGQIIKVQTADDINAKLQSKFLKVIDGIEVTCDLSVKAK